MKRKKLLLWYPNVKGDDIIRGEYLTNQPLGLGIVARLTPDSWDVKIKDCNFEPVEFEDADLIGISAMTAQIGCAYDIAKMYREKGIPVVLGGIHATVCTEEAQNYVDCVVKGEAESVWPQVIKDFENNCLNKLYEPKALMDLTNLPKPRRDLFDPRYKIGIVQTSRGCPFDCDFCSVTHFNGHEYRRRPANEVLDEIEEEKRKFLFICDDNMYGYKQKDIQIFKEICKGLIERNIKKYWWTQLSLNILEDEEAIELAAKAGCIQVILGIESSSANILSGEMNKKHNIKYIQNDKPLKLLNKHGISSMSIFIHGYDAEKENLFEDNYNFHKEIGLDIGMATTLQPHPGTRLFERLKTENRLYYTSYPADWKYYTGSRMPVYKMQNYSNYEYLYLLYKYNKKYLGIRGILFKSLRIFFRKYNLFAAISAASVNMNFRTAVLRAVKKNLNIAEKEMQSKQN